MPLLSEALIDAIQRPDDPGAIAGLASAMRGLDALMAALGGPSGSKILGSSIQGGSARFGGGSVLLGNQGLDIRDLDGVGRRPEIHFSAGDGSGQGSRIAGYSGAANEAGLYLARNMYFDGTDWNLDDESIDGNLFNPSGGAITENAFEFRRAPAGTNPRTSAMEVLLSITQSGIIRLPESTATISSGEITLTGSLILVDTQGGASSDNLDILTIPTGEDTVPNGMLVILRPADGAHTVVVRHNVNNIYLKSGSNYTMDNMKKAILLLSGNDGSYNGQFFELGRL